MLVEHGGQCFVSAEGRTVESDRCVLRAEGKAANIFLLPGERADLSRVTQQKQILVLSIS